MNTKQYSQVTVSKVDKQDYLELAAQLSSEYGIRISVPAALRLAVTHFKDNRPKPGEPLPNKTIRVL